MYQTITQSNFIDIMNQTRPNQISYEGLQALFDFYEDIEDQNKPMELDPIAIFCDWTEYDHISEVIEAYSHTLDTGDDEDYKHMTAEYYHTHMLEKLKDHTTIIASDNINDTILIMDF